MDSSKKLRLFLTLMVPSTMLAASILALALYLILDAIFCFAENARMPLLIPLLALGSSVIIGSVLSAVVSRTALRPLTDLIQATAAVAAGNFSVRIDARRTGGLYGDFVRSFNKMVEELGNVELFHTDFINTFSHELKTPMVSLRGYAQFLKRGDLTEQERRSALDAIIREMDRLTQMAASVLLLCKYENTQILAGQKPYALDEQIRQCIGRLQESWMKKDIVLLGDLEAVEYFGNEDVMDHVWLNLLSNAIKFSPQGGEISVSLHRRHGYIVAAIRDQGPGMEEATAQRVFDQFFKGDSSHSTEGNGLGLSIAKRILDLCGGEIRLQTAPGAGSTFTVLLPENERGALPAVPAASGAENPRR
ncbi:MAG TPA: HAMP domain-containing histidine kinase [Candidatus Aphodomonas merdavium]|nr:HAMP domain-containing histidine kinase [Candidatus Aphodomonas merdavium]